MTPVELNDVATFKDIYCDLDLKEEQVLCRKQVGFAKNLKELSYKDLSLPLRSIQVGNDFSCAIQNDKKSKCFKIKSENLPVGVPKELAAQ